MNQNVSGEYGMLIDELNPDNKVDLFAIHNESIIYPNEVENKTIEYSTDRQKMQALSQHVRIIPFTIEIQGELHNSTWLNPINDKRKRPTDKAWKLKNMRDSVHTFRYMSTTFYGDPFKNMVIKEVNLQNDANSGNYIPYTLVLQEVLAVKVNDFFGKTIPDAISRGLVQLVDLIVDIGKFVVHTVINIVRGFLGFVGGLIGGFLNLFTGSLPWQIFQTEIEGRKFEFETRWDQVNDMGVFSMRDPFAVQADDIPILTENPIIYGQDLLADSQDDERVRGLHIIPLAIDGVSTIVTEDNIGKSVQLVVVIEKTLDELALLKVRGAEVIAIA